MVAADGAPIARPRRRLLVLGSSVAEGAGAEEGRGWAHLLAKVVETHGVDVHNLAVGGTNVGIWRSRLADETWVREQLAGFDIVFVSLSLANEGMAICTSEAEIHQLAERYAAGYREIAQILRRLSPPGTRLVFGGPYPNEDYEESHLRALEGVREAICKWEEVDYAVDFLAASVHGGSGRWVRGLAQDAGHPNDAGHARMFSCIDIAQVLGPEPGRGPQGQD